MPQIIEAVYENGVIKPLEKVKVEENKTIMIKIVRKKESVVERTFNKFPMEEEKIKKLLEETENEWGVY